MAITERIKSILGIKPVQPTEVKPFDFFEQIKIDYGITKVGEKEFQVVVDGMTYKGTLSTIMNIAKGTRDDIWGNP